METMRYGTGLGRRPTAKVGFVLRRRHAIAAFAVATAVISTGFRTAMQNYPGGFDWNYTVVSALASTKHNPDGAAWCSGSIVVAMFILSPLVMWLQALARRVDRGSTIFISILIAGMSGSALVGLEMLSGIHLASVVRKGHEILALATFVCLYSGILGLFARRLRSVRSSVWSISVVLLPLMGTGVAGFLLYMDQRDLGWVDRDWRELGIPVWMSFAFWQWLALATLWIGLGWLAMPALRWRRESA